MKKLLFLTLLVCTSSMSFAADVYVNLAGLENKGQLMVALHRSQTTFDNESATPYRYEIIKVSRSTMQIHFKNVPVGEYAVSLIHDKNMNNKLDKNFLGIPKEPFGFSNNPKIMMSAPRFQECTFLLNQTDVKQINIKLINML